jgi:hypothetical protein
MLTATSIQLSSAHVYTRWYLPDHSLEHGEVFSP